MDSFEWNKIIGAVLGTVMFVVGLYIFVGGMMAPHKAEKPGMEVAVTETSTTPGQPAVAEAPIDWGTVLPAADIAAGENVGKRCLQCHDFTKGGPHKIGPNLWGIVGAAHGHAAGYAYSPAMRALSDRTWDYAALGKFLANPKAEIAGTKMAFAGLSKTADRVNIIAYLRTLSDTPAAIPAPNPAAPPPSPAEGAAEEGTPSEGAPDAPAGEVQAPAPGTAPAPGGGSGSTPPAQAPTPSPSSSGGH